jgi:hypothetical protein
MRKLLVGSTGVLASNIMAWRGGGKDREIAKIVIKE